MCGIFGYVGKDPGGIRILLDGLRNLEHRGYDSIGMAYLSEGEEEILKISAERKAEISIRDLEVRIGDLKKECFIGIGHTRWASCGEVSDRNAHPHIDNLRRVTVVHNGNIENFSELKKELQEAGSTFYSETDTEVIAHLFARVYRGDLVEAGEEVSSRLVGANAFVVMIKEKYPKLLAVNRGGTLLVGQGSEGTVITSDPLAFPRWIKKRTDLESHEIAIADPAGFEIFRNDRRIRKNAVPWKSERFKDISGGESFMLKEIMEQPEILRNVMSGRFSRDRSTAKLGGLEVMDHLIHRAGTFYFIGCGTAYFACQYAAMILEHLGIPARAGVASEFRYLEPRVAILCAGDWAGDCFIFLSQSGETADLIKVLEKIKSQGNPVFGLVNVVDSKIARMTDAGVYIRAGVERGVASTKAYTAHLVTSVLLSLYLSRSCQLTADTGARIISELEMIPDKVGAIISDSAHISALVAKYRDFRNYYFLGRHFNYITAQEGALKLKEVSYVHAESCPLGEMKHGPLALVDEKFCSVVVVPNDSVFKKSLANIREIKARHGKVIAITNAQTAEELRNIVDDVITVPETLEFLSPILTVIPLQLFAYYMALELGKNPDKPRNLAKTVTVE